MLPLTALAMSLVILSTPAFSQDRVAFGSDQLHRGTLSSDSGFSYVFGADIARVAENSFAPDDQGFVAPKSRMRARAGVHFQIEEDINFFYGMTYLNEEFDGQEESQVLGSLKLNFVF